MTELRLRKERNRFHFYFGDSLELCLTNEELHNKMHVIHCSCDLVRHAGLANLLPVVNSCLNGDIPEAVLVTEIIAAQLEDDKSALVGYVESDLCCSLTMTPTVYGMRLLDNVHLGSSICCQLHDYIKSEVPMTLKWCKSPVAYSNNVKLYIIPVLQQVTKLTKSCFGSASVSLYCHHEDSSCTCQLYLRITDFVKNSPLTFYNIWQPLLSRHIWKEDFTQFIIEHVLPANLRLAWKTLEDWMEGKQVLLFYNNSSDVSKAILDSLKDHGCDKLCVNIVLKPVCHKTRHRLGQTVSEDFFSDAHYVFNLNWKDLSEFSVSFLLAKNHGLDSTIFFIVDKDNMTILYSTSLTSQSMQRKVVTNPNPRPLLQHRNVSNDLFDLRCQETEDQYKLKIVFPSENQQSSGNLS